MTETQRLEYWAIFDILINITVFYGTFIVLLPFLELGRINHSPLSLYGKCSLPITFSFSLKKEDDTGLE